MNEKSVTSQQREFVRERAQRCCEYCRSQEGFATHTFEVDHIVPRYLGGKTTEDNLALACRGCNNYKGGRIEGEDPETSDIVPLYHPRQQQWSGHFEWNGDFSCLRGRTHTGRATVGTLQLNRNPLVNMRRVLRQVRKHPPPDRQEGN
jgi:hypothetical protein